MVLPGQIPNESADWVRISLKPYINIDFQWFKCQQCLQLNCMFKLGKHTIECMLTALAVCQYVLCILLPFLMVFKRPLISARRAEC